MYNGPNRKKLRLKNFNYSEDGYYFVTICTKNKKCHFGDIVDGEMILNKYGEIAESVFLDLPNHYTNCSLSNYVFMPNHFHGIFIIENTVGNGLKPFPELQYLYESVLNTYRNGFKPFPT